MRIKPGFDSLGAHRKPFNNEVRMTNAIEEAVARKPVSRTMAVKKYLSEGTTLETREFMEFWRECSAAQRLDYATDAAEIMGLTLAGE